MKKVLTKDLIIGINYFDAMVLPTEMKFIGLDETGDPNFTYVSGEKTYGTGKIMFFKHCEFYELGEEVLPTQVRIKPYRGGFRFDITFANGEKPNHVYNTRAAAKKGLKDLAEALTNYEIVK